MNQSNKINLYSTTIAILIITGLFLLGFASVKVLTALTIRLATRPQPAQATTTLSPNPTQGSATRTAPALILPTIAFTPTSGCSALTLMIASTAFQIQTLQPAPDGSVAMPADSHGIAYWVAGTDTNYLFVLSPASDNAALAAALTERSVAKATWVNCNSITYILSAPRQESFNVSVLMDQSATGITIFFQTDSSGDGFIVRGELTEEQINFIDTPAPGGSGIQAEISLLETTTSADGTTIQIGITIQNFGQAAFALSASEVALTPQDAQPMTQIASEPALPKEIKLGATETFYFTFARPSTLTATIKIFGVEYILEGY